MYNNEKISLTALILFLSNKLSVNQTYFIILKCKKKKRVAITMIKP